MRRGVSCRAVVLVGLLVAATSIGCSGGATGTVADDVSGFTEDATATALDAARADDRLAVKPVDASTMDAPTLDASTTDVTAPTVDVVTIDAVVSEVFSGCRSNADCRESEFGFYTCDMASARCGGCSPASDACPAGQYCDPARLTCTRGCRTDESCRGAGGGTPRCDPTTRLCVQCATDDQCTDGRRCMGNTCVSACEGGTRCPGTQACCSGGCVDPQSNAAHCGGCGTRCTVANGEGACVMGRCAVGTCAGAYRDCNLMAADGCETNTTSDRMNCGGCGRFCPTPPHSTPTCASGRCGSTCETGWADCNGDASDGCETDVTRDPAHCGSCAVACPSAGASATCSMGRCGLGPCLAGYANCDGNPANGCETELASSPLHCGVCGRRCPTAAHASASCGAGTCALRCDAGWGDCNGDPIDGCEANLATTREHCGVCGRRCVVTGGTGVCNAGRCDVARCEDGLGNCDGDAANGCETNVLSTPTHCGACGRGCAIANGSGACAGGRCAVASCATGYADCNGDATDGCETDLRTTLSSCGACGTVCRAANGTPACTAGRCVIGACAADWANCDGDATNGCEANIQNERFNCGGCGRPCSLANGSGGCAMGRCVVASCAPGFADCNGLAADGCETAVYGDTDNCGVCGRRCPAGEGGALASCRAGVCGLSACPSGVDDCDGSSANGCETTTATDVSNCGACGRRCPALPNATPRCFGGACGLSSCDAGYADCDGATPNGCEVNTGTSTLHCGGCGRMCSLPNATAACLAGTCAVGSCNAGFADCNGLAADGCEVDTRNDAGHCGRCEVSCASPGGGSARCSAGACVSACPSGQSVCGGACQSVGSACVSGGSGGCEERGVLACVAGSVRCSATPRTSGSCIAPASGVCGSGGACACATGSAECSGVCRNVAADPANCGACGAVCPTPSGGVATCVGGRCGSTCPTGQTDCGGACRSTGAGCTVGSGGCEATGTVTCSGSATACSAVPRTSGACSGLTGGSCNSAGACACTAGMQACSGVCVDLDGDAANCGVCGRACGPGRACSAGVCVGTGPLRFTLTWDVPGDMDLHVTPPCGSLIYWATAGRLVCDGLLDRDDTSGSGPENVFWASTPTRGTYTVCAAPYGIRAETRWTIEVFHGAVLVDTFSGVSTVSTGNTCGVSFTHTY